MNSNLVATIVLILMSITKNALTSKLVPGGKNVCKHRQSVIMYSTRQTKVNTLETYSACCSKFLFCWKKCKRTRTKTKTITITVSELRHEDVHHCCEGYAVDSSGTQCTTPICDPPCENGGKCIRPGVCDCQSGFEGLLCQNDINECSTVGIHECSQRCINIPGSYLCACNRGFVPGDPNSKTCKDIDECKQLSTDGKGNGPCRCIAGKCGNRCQNTIGGYRCSCGDGYKLTLWNNCVDRNECIETPEVCSDRCINTPGSYRCECWEGFRWNKVTGKCEEIDECSIGNGGCEHLCHNVYGGHVCSCKSGFFLADNRFSCIDINECHWATRCDPRRSRCVNIPGSYYCKCKTGFKFLEPYGICLDRDECKEKTALCNQKCFNTFGSYRCGCENGYYLDRDKRTCIDINECSQNRCDQVCVNTPGSYKCFCNQGYELDIDDKSCLPKFCERIQAPFFGRISCDGYSVGKRCRFSCKEGFHLDNDITRECLPDGKWSNSPPKCIPNSCKQPRPPVNGKLLLPCDVSYGSTCPVTCVDGYVLRGPDLITCVLSGSAVYWNIDQVRCEEILVCKPNPCQHGGICTIVSPTTYSCNCSGTGYEGDHCQVGFVTTERLPKLKKNEAVAMTFGAKPEKAVELRIFPEDNSLKISKEVIRITSSKQSDRIEITGTEVGMKLLSYELASEELYAAPKPSLLLIYDPLTVDGSRVETLSSLGSDCFSMILTWKMKSCPAMNLVSTAPLFKRSSSLPSTNGIAFILAAGEKFPLLLPGTDQREIFMDSELSYTPVKRPPGCRKRLLSEEQLQYIGKYDIFSRDFLKVFNKFMPSWLQLSLRETMKHFSEDMVRSLIVKGSKVKAKKYCSAMAVDDNSIFLVHLIYEHLVIRIGEDELVMKTNKAFCLAFDVCKKEAHIQFPVQNALDIANLLPFQELASLKWKVAFRSLGFAETNRNDPRKCVKKDANEKMILFGGSRVEYTNKYGINSYATGIMAAGFKTKESKILIDSSRLCMDGQSLMESPSWKSSRLVDNSYRVEDNQDTDVVKLTISTVGPQKSIFSLEQHGGTVFRMKSGLRPLIRKSSRDIRFDVSYKVTEKSSAMTTDSNYDKYTSIETISYSVSDIDMELELMSTPRYLAAGINNLRSELKAWLDTLNSDIDEMLIDIDNTKLINDKSRVHVRKGNKVVQSILNLLNPVKASIDSDVFERIENALKDIQAELAKMGKGLKVLTIRTFESLSVHFNGTMCLFQPCIDTVSVELHPQSIETPWDGFCYDPSKTSFQIWDTKARVLTGQDLGSFFTVTSGDRFHLCYSVFGISKGEFNGRFRLLGGSHRLLFKYSDKKISVPEFSANIGGGYRFQVNATVETVLNRWDMMSVAAYGTANSRSKIVKKLQKNMDALVAKSYNDVKARENKNRARLQRLVYKKSSLRGAMSHFQKEAKEAEHAYNQTRRVFLDSEVKFNDMRLRFASKRIEYVSMNRRLDTICKVSSCRYQCHKVNNCTVCQKEITTPKTIPKCQRGHDSRTYAYKDNINTICSHFVEDRRLKYTGNCKRPVLEKHRAKQIADRLKRKQEKKEPFTLEDAWDLQMIDEKEGKKLEEAVRRQMFWRAFPGKLQSGSLSDKDFERIEIYTNRTFAQKMRAAQKQSKLKILWDELSLKIKSGGRLNDADIERIRKLNSTFAAKLKISMDINEKLQSGEQPSKEQLKLFEKLDPRSYAAFVEQRKVFEARRDMIGRISRKLRQGTLTAADLKELSKVDPKAAKAIEDGLKEQLKQKIDEMKGKLDNVSSAISTGDGKDRFGKLNKKLAIMTKKLRPIDRKQLEDLQNRIKNSIAARGSVFDKMSDRFELAIELRDITGVSSELFRSLKVFFAALGSFDFDRAFLQTENMIVKQLEYLQNWFQTLISLLEKLCSGCGKSCERGGIFKRAMEEIRLSIGKFKSRVCRKDALVDTKGLCSSLSGVISFVERYDILQSGQCGKIMNKLLPSVQKIVDEIKNLGRTDATVFEKMWKKSKSTLSIERSYRSIVTGLKDALLTSSVEVNFPAPKFTVITNEVGKIVRPGLYSTKDIHYVIAREALTAFNNALKILPINEKKMKSKNIAIPAAIQKSLATKFQALFDGLTDSLLNQCSLAVDKSEIAAATDRRVKRVLIVAKRIFGKMLNEKDLLSLFRGAKTVAATLEHALRMSDVVKAMGLRCSNKTDSPFAELESFLQDVKDFGAKSVQQLSNEIGDKFRDIGEGVKAPIGKLVNLVETLADNAPNFNFPVIMSMGQKEAKLLLEASKKYLKMLGDVFSKLLEVIGRCEKCKIEEVFGKYNLKSIAEKLDRKIGPIGARLDKFISDIGFAFQGTPLLLSSLEQIRTDLQSIYSSGSRYNEKTFSDIVDGVKYATEAIDLMEKGQVELQSRLAGSKNMDIKKFVQEAKKLKSYMLELFEKTKDPKTQKVVVKIKKILSGIPVLTKEIDLTKKGTVNQLLDVISGIGDIANVVTVNIRELYGSPLPMYVENTWLPKVAKSLDETDKIKLKLVAKTERLLIDLGIIQVAHGAKQDVQNLKRRKFSSIYKELRNSSKNRKIAKASQIARKSQSDDNVMKRITAYWSGVYKKVAGTIDNVKSQVFDLRKKFKKYLKLYKDIKGVVEEIKKGPITDIGQLKDNLEDLTGFFKDYNFKTLLVTDPSIFRKKITELKALFQLTGDALKAVDTLLQNCTSCSADKVLGYRYIKRLAKTVSTPISTFVDFLQGFGEKIEDGVTEIQDMNRAMMRLQRRFKKIGTGEKKASEILKEFGRAMEYSTNDMKKVESSIERFTEILIDKDVDIQLLGNNIREMARQLGTVVNKSAEVAVHVEDAYEEVKRLEGILTGVLDSKQRLGQGALQTRIAVARKASQSIKKAINALPRVLSSSKKALDSAGINGDWIDRFQSGLLAAASSLEKIRLKTDAVLDTAGIVVGGKENISEKLSVVKESLKDLRDAPWDKKLKSVKDVSKTLEALMGSSLEAVVSTSNSLGAELTKEGLTKSVGDLVGKKRLEKLNRISDKIFSTADKLQRDSLPEIGKLTDSVEDYVDNLKNFDIKEALLSEPSALEEKIGEFQDLADRGGDILLDIVNITGACNKCTLEGILSNGFVKKISKDIAKTFDRLYDGVRDISSRIKKGSVGIQRFMNSAQDISQRFNSVLRNGQISSDAFSNAAAELRKSARNLQSVKSASKDVFEAILDDNKDIMELQKSFNSVVDIISSKLERGSELSERVEKAYATIEDIKNTIDGVSSNFKNIGRSPLELKTELARKMITGVQEIFSAVPAFLKQSANVSNFLGGNSAWLDNLSSEILTFNNRTKGIFSKTDSMLKSAGLVAKDIEGISSTSTKIFEDIKQMRSLPVEEKVKKFKSIVTNINKVFDGSVEAALKIESITRDLTGTKLNISEGIGKFGESLSGIMRNVSIGIAFTEGLFNDITSTVDQIKLGPVAKVGALKDSVEDFLGSMNKYDLSEVLVQAPKFAKEKIGELKAVIKDSGEILKNVSSLVDKYCPLCKIDDIFGGEFTRKIGKAVKTGFSRITGNVTKFLDKVEEGGENVLAISNSIKGIDAQFKSLSGIKFNSDGLKKVANALTTTSGLIGGIGDKSGQLAGVLFEKNKALNKLTGKFEGLVSFVGGFINSTGKAVRGMSGVLDRVEKIRDLYEGVSAGFSAVGKGPLESRIKAIDNVANGLVELATGIPDLVDSLGPDNKFATFVRGFGSKVSDIANGINDVVKKTTAVAGDVSQTIKAVDSIGRISSNIGNSFKKILSSPFSGKITAVKDMVGQIKSLTGAVNAATGTISSTVNKLTGKSILKLPIFGKTTEKVLDDISGAVNLVADRYEKFQSLTRTVDKAFKSISSDPIDFALNDLPQLVKQTDSLVSTLLNDTKGVIGKLGLELEGLNLNPELVSASKEFFSFAKSTLGTIQSGKELFGSFRDLFSSKDFLSGMKNFQTVIKTGSKFMENIDGLGQQLFKEKWSGIKGDFQKALNKIGDSVGLNLKETGGIFGKISGSMGDLISIASDVKKLIGMKEFNLETAMGAAKSVISIGKNVVNVLNRFGANIQTKVFEKISGALNVVASVFNIAKGVFDFIKWANDVCDITYVSSVNKRELKYRCLKGKTSTMVIKIPVMKCEYETINVTRGFGNSSLCCSGKQCIYVQDQGCVMTNALCVEKRKRFASQSPLISKELAAVYLKYEEAKLSMELAQINMKTAETMYRRKSLAYSLSLSEFKMNALDIKETEQRMASIRRDLIRLRRVTNQDSTTSKIRFVKAEFSTVFYSADVGRLPLKVLLQDETRSYKIARFIVDFKATKLSLKQAVEYLLRTMTDYKFTRKRRAIRDTNEATRPDNVDTCAELKNGLSLISVVTQNLRKSINEVPHSRGSYIMRRTGTSSMSRSMFSAMRQLFQETRQLDLATSLTLIKAVSEWDSSTQQLIREAYKQDCLGFNECAGILVDAINQHIGSSSSKALLLMADLRRTISKLSTIVSARLLRSSILLMLEEVNSNLTVIENRAVFCQSPPVFKRQQPSSLTAYLGEELTLSCEINSRDSALYMWFLNKTALPAFNDEILRISNVTSAYEGSYHCKVYTESGTVESNPVYVSIEKRIEFLEDLQSVSIADTNLREVQLICNTSAESDASYTWWHQSLAGTIRKLRASSAMLKISVPRAREKGIYWCEVSNGHMKLRSRKAVVAVVQSKMRTHSVRFEMRSFLKGRNCRLPSTAALFASEMKKLILKGNEVSGYQSKVVLEQLPGNEGKLSIVLLFEARGSKLLSELDLTAWDAQMQYNVQKIANSFIDDMETAHISANDCIFSLMKPNANMEFDPAGWQCPSGMGIAKGRVRCETCLPGFFETGLSSCKKCPRGTFQPRFGARSCIPCGDGYLTPFAGSLDHSSCVFSEFKCFDRMNLMIAVDVSVARSKDRVRSFVNGLTRRFDSKYAKIRIASFGNAAQLLLSIDIGASEADSIIANVHFGTAERRTDLLLDMAIGLFETEDPGHRNALLIVTHGPTTHNKGSIEEKVTRLKDMGTEIFYMSTDPSATREEAMLSSSSPKESHIFTSQNDAELVKSSTYLAYSICDDGDT